MIRQEMISRLEEQTCSMWDMLVIGGGATGVGIAVDAASRGYDVLLVEQNDFGKGTSSRSTKLVHGGVRYLQQGNVSLVMEALKERGIMRQNAPHLVSDLRFIVPNYDWWEAPFYGIGLKIYDMLAGKYGFGPSKMLSREETIKYLPTIRTDGLLGGVQYYDGQFDDARLLINLAETAVRQGATLINYTKAVALDKSSQDFVKGAIIQDLESGTEYHVKAKTVVNATGPFTDSVRRMDNPDIDPIISPSQGVHLVLSRDFLPADSAIMVPHTRDGRVMFALPWHDHALVGTTDTELKEVSLEPIPLDEEISFILETATQYLRREVIHQDILSAFAGIRPLVSTGKGSNTAALSRDHTVQISNSGLITICGGKWTTYRNMAEDCVNQAAMLGHLEERPCVTKQLNIHGYHRRAEKFGDLASYGSDATLIQDLVRTSPELGEKLHEKLPYIKAEVIWGTRMEMARTVDDMLGRRLRATQLNINAAIKMAPEVARLMAVELGHDEHWQEEQLKDYHQIATNYQCMSVL